MLINPYICRKPFNYYKIALIPLAILRLVLITFTLLSLYGIILIDTRKKYRNAVVSSVSWLLVFISGFYYVKKSRILKKNNIVVVYNHSSIFDSLLILGHVGFVAPVIYHKYYLSIKPLADYCDAVTVNTDSTGNLHKIIGKSVFIAPEGTISNGEYLLRFKTGAFVTDLQVLPVVIKYPNTSASWYTNVNPAFTIFALLCNVWNNVEITGLPLCYRYGWETPQDFCERVRKNMSTQSGIPLLEVNGYHKFRV
jgi:1-acyl-sn-glycerol-3-phosphate acyltransferase